jgi:hypothetical protein
MSNAIAIIWTGDGILRLNRASGEQQCRELSPNLHGMFHTHCIQKYCPPNPDTTR